MSDLPPLPPFECGIYKHYKGGIYTATGLVRHSETLEPMVVYGAVDGSGTWVRPLSMWSEMVDGKPRFERIQIIPASA
mgnify:CR=1 FL=1